MKNNIEQQIESIKTHIFDGKDVPIAIVNDPSNNYSVDWENKILNVSYVVTPGSEPDIEDALHEMAHYMIAPSEGLHLPSWGMSNPYVGVVLGEFYEFGNQAGNPGLDTEAKVWAWQHLLAVMAGFRDISEVPSHPEGRHTYDAPSEDALEIIKKRIDKHLTSIYERFPNETWRDEIKRKFADVGRVLEDESRRQPDGEFSEISSTCLSKGVYAIVEHGASEWYQLYLEHRSDTGETNYHRVTMTRNPERIQKFFDIIQKTFEPIPKREAENKHVAPAP